MKLFAFILGITIPLLALFLSFIVSPVLGDLLFKPAILISTILDKIYIDMPYNIHSLLVFLVGTLLLIVSFFFGKIAIKNYFFKKRKVIL